MSQNITRLLVIRHGETAWNLETRIQGHIDIPLNDNGRMQAQRLARALTDEGLDALYASDLRRAYDTALAISQATGLPVSAHEGLRERRFGRMEGMTQEEIAAQWPEEARRWRAREPAYGPQGGETLQSFYDRCIDAATMLAQRHAGQTIALIAHGGVLDCFYRAATRAPLTTPRSWKIANASINRILYSPEGFSLVGWADNRHLEGERGSLDESTDGRIARAG